MKTLIGGAVAAVLGLIGLSVWFGAFLQLLAGALPVMLLLGGGLALYLGFDELKDTWKKDDSSLDTEAASDDSGKYQQEIDDLKKEIRLHLPKSLFMPVPREDLLELANVLKEEINVKDIEVVSEVGELVNYKLMPNNRVLGPRLGRMFPKVKAALEQLDPAEAARSLQGGQSVQVVVDGQTFELGSDDVLVQTESRGGLAVASDRGITVAVDTKLTPELLREGYARDLVRTINNMRKDAGFDISDRIEVVYQADGEVADAIRDFGDYIKQETLALALERGVLADATVNGQIKVGGQDVLIAFRIAG